MLVCDHCKTPMKHPKYTLDKLTVFSPERDIPQGTPGAEFMPQVFASLKSFIPQDQMVRGEVIAHFDKMECVTKWAAERSKELDAT